MGSIPVAGATTKGLPKGNPFVVALARKPISAAKRAELGSHLRRRASARWRGGGKPKDIRQRRNSRCGNELPKGSPFVVAPVREHISAVCAHPLPTKKERTSIDAVR